MTRIQRLWAVLALNLVLIVGLAAVGFTAHSLGVLAAAVDYLGDAAAVGLALFAISLSRHPHGHPRAGLYAATANGCWLLLLCLAVIAESARRLVTGAPEVRGLPVLVISAVAALLMALAAVILHADSEAHADRGSALNVHAVLLDTVADAAAGAGVAATGAVILLTGRFFWLDPSIALAIAAVIAFHALRLLREVRGELRTIAANPRVSP